MEDRGNRQRDLIPVFGSSSVVSDVLNGKRSISKAHARKLAEFSTFRPACLSKRRATRVGIGRT
jgi:HTH-type transcriptional regulator/antitoxin HigA